MSLQQQQTFHSDWLQRRRQKRRRLVLGRTTFMIGGLALTALVLTAIGIIFTAQGATVLTVIGILVALIAWLFPVQANSVQNLQPPLIPSSQPINAAPPTISLLPQPDSIFFPVSSLHDPNNFYGRVSERRTLLDRTRQRSSTSIIGPRRIGKTWLLDYIRLVAPTELGPDYYVVTLDATSASCRTVAEFVESLLTNLKEQIKARPDDLPIIEKALQNLAQEQAKPHPNTLKVVETAILELSRAILIPILCIDEFEGFSNTPARKQEFDLEFFRSLRVMSNSSNLVLVVASKTPLKKIIGRVGRTSGFFNIFEQITIRPFTRKEAEEFIQTKGDQAYFTDVDRDYMLRFGKQGWFWPMYWPLRLELFGKMLLQDKTLAVKENDPSYYRPDDPAYWRNFKRRLEERYRAVL